MHDPDSHALSPRLAELEVSHSRESRSGCGRVAGSASALGVRAAAAELAGQVGARAHMRGIALLGLRSALGPVEWSGLFVRLGGEIRLGGRLRLLGVGRDWL